MARTKLVSVRIGEDVLKEIDAIAEGTEYWKRSDVINGALKFMVAAHKAGLSRDIVRFYPEFGDEVDEITFKYHRKHK